MIRLNIKENKLKIAATSVLVFLGVAIVPQVLADELVISDNGANSSNEVHATVSSNTDVQQNNNADVHNDVKVNENTGNNSASDNTGGSTNINTGNANSSTSISNSANVSSVKIDNCNCESSGSVKISGNGAYSDNKVNANFTNDNNVRVNQNANITNNIDEYAVTGRNDANDNTNGDVFIKTGNINAKTNLLNGLLNFSDIAIAGGPLHDFLVKIFGNGAFSDNNANVRNHNTNDVLVNNSLDVINNLRHRYITGENDANLNTHGDVNVETGDINSEVNIKNEGNISKVKITCECVTPTVAPTGVPSVPSVTVTTPTSTPESAPTVTPTGAPAAAAATATPAPEQVLGASAIMPVTGSNVFFFMLIGSVVMLLTGAYLRLRSGNAPGMAI